MESTPTIESIYTCPYVRQNVIESEIVEVLIIKRDENAKKLIKYTFGKPKRRNSFWIGLDLV